MNWLRTFIVICAVVFALTLGTLILLVSFVDLGMSVHGIVALFLGSLITLGLGMVLMGLVFMSSRNEHDGGVQRTDDNSGP